MEPSWRVLEWVRDLRRAVLEGGGSPLPLVLGGAQLKALNLVLEGRGTVVEGDVRSVLEASARALGYLGVPVALVEGALSGSSYRDVLLLALSLDPRRGGPCVRELQTRVALFALYLERGDYPRAGKLAEEVLAANSILLGLAMLRLVEAPVAYVVAQRPGPAVEVSQELVEELVERLRELNVDLREVLSRYSLQELVELYEELKRYSPEVVLAALRYGNLTLPPVYAGPRELGGDLEEDVVRPGVYYGQGERGGSPTTPGSTQSTAVDYADISLAIGRLPGRLISRVAEVASSVSLAHYSRASGRVPEEVPRRVEVAVPGSRPAIQVAVVAAVASVAIPVALVALRRTSRTPETLRRWVPAVPHYPSTTYRNVVVEVFWRVIDVVGRRVRVRIGPSDTHREIVSRMSSSLGSAEAEALRELGRLYELARFSARQLDPGDVGRVGELARRLGVRDLEVG
ncbi:MAG: DUF4129 domain-containing protein [Desulfurococcaceae archaeon]|nr:DUF4129 domain-containing protein [Desulfurococcaceae archaeon]